MADLKTEMGARFGIAFISAIIIYALISPIVNWYIGLSPMTSTCGTNEFCTISKTFINTVLPVGALFLCVLSVIEVFSK